MSRITEFIELVKANPDLPIIPMVDAEIVGDDYGWWLGEWGYSEVTEYYNGREKIAERVVELIKAARMEIHDEDAD